MRYAFLVGLEDKLVWPSGHSDVAASMTKADVVEVKEKFGWIGTIQPWDFVLDAESVAGELAAAVETAVAGSLDESE